MAFHRHSEIIKLCTPNNIHDYAHSPICQNIPTRPQTFLYCAESLCYPPKPGLNFIIISQIASWFKYLKYLLINEVFGETWSDQRRRGQARLEKILTLTGAFITCNSIVLFFDWKLNRLKKNKKLNNKHTFNIFYY